MSVGGAEQVAATADAPGEESQEPFSCEALRRALQLDALQTKLGCTGSPRAAAAVAAKAVAAAAKALAAMPGSAGRSPGAREAPESPAREPAAPRRSERLAARESRSPRPPPTPERRSRGRPRKPGLSPGPGAAQELPAGAQEQPSGEEPRMEESGPEDTKGPPEGLSGDEPRGQDPQEEFSCSALVRALKEDERQAPGRSEPPRSRSRAAPARRGAAEPAAARGRRGAREAADERPTDASSGPGELQAPLREAPEPATSASEECLASSQDGGNGRGPSKKEVSIEAQEAALVRESGALPSPMAEQPAGDPVCRPARPKRGPACTLGQKRGRGSTSAAAAGQRSGIPKKGGGSGATVVEAGCGPTRRFASLGRRPQRRHNGEAPQSGVKGVCWCRHTKAWKAYFCVRGERFESAYFYPKDDTPKELERARLAAVSRRRELELQHGGAGNSEEGCSGAPPTPSATTGAPRRRVRQRKDADGSGGSKEQSRAQPGPGNRSGALCQGEPERELGDRDIGRGEEPSLAPPMPGTGGGGLKSGALASAVEAPGPQPEAQEPRESLPKVAAKNLQVPSDETARGASAILMVPSAGKMLEEPWESWPAATARYVQAPLLEEAQVRERKSAALAALLAGKKKLEGLRQWARPRASALAATRAVLRAALRERKRQASEAYRLRRRSAAVAAAQQRKRKQPGPREPQPKQQRCGRGPASGPRAAGAGGAAKPKAPRAAGAKGPGKLKELVKQIQCHRRKRWQFSKGPDKRKREDPAFRGVSWEKGRACWHVQCFVNGQHLRKRYYPKDKTPEKVEQARKSALAWRKAELKRGKAGK